MPKQVPQRSSASPFDVLARRKATLPESADGRADSTSGRPDGQESDSADQDAAGTRGGKRSDPEFHKLTVYISKSTHRTAKAIAGLQGREMSDIVEDLLRSYVRENHDSALKSL